MTRDDELIEGLRRVHKFYKNQTHMEYEDWRQIKKYAVGLYLVGLPFVAVASLIAKLVLQ